MGGIQETGEANTVSSITEETRPSAKTREEEPEESTEETRRQIIENWRESPIGATPGVFLQGRPMEEGE